MPIRHASQGNYVSTPGGNNSRDGISYDCQQIGYFNDNNSRDGISYDCHRSGIFTDNDSTYFKDSGGSSTYTSPSGNVTKK